LTERATGAKDEGSAETTPHETTAGNAEAMTQGGNDNNGSFNMRKRINSTIYEVAVYFNKASNETLDDKILRLVRSEALNREDE
jgi:hypothetical protein